MNNQQLTKALHTVMSEVERHELLISVLVDRGVLTPEDIHLASLQIELRNLDRRINAGMATTAESEKAVALRRALARLP